MRSILILTLTSLLLFACSESDNPTDPGSDTTPTPPEGWSDGGLSGRWIADNGLGIIDDHVSYNGEQKETIFKAKSEGPGNFRVWIAGKNPYGAGGWVVMEGYLDSPAFELDCTYDGKTTRRKFTRQ